MDIIFGPDGEDERWETRVELDGTGYLLTWTWNELTEGWYLDIALDDETPLVNGIRVVAQWSLLSQHYNTRPQLPQGILVVRSKTDEDLSDPGRADLDPDGGRCEIVYFTLEERTSIQARTQELLAEGGRQVIVKKVI